MSSSCYECGEKARSSFTCILCETLVQHGIIGPEEIFVLRSCTLHERETTGALKAHLRAYHPQAPAIGLLKSFRKS